MDKKVEFECSCGNDKLVSVYDEATIHKSADKFHLDQYGELAWEDAEIVELETESCEFDMFRCGACGNGYKWDDESKEFVEYW